MKRILTISVILLFIWSILSPTGFSIDQSPSRIYDGKTLYVGGSGPGNYTKIQDAIDDASDGDTVFVYNGTYYENVNVGKSIYIIGEDKNTTILDGNNLVDYVINISADNVILSGFTIQNSNFLGIGMLSSNNVIKNNIITNSEWFGIYAIGSKNNISNNIISRNNWSGIHCELSNQKIICNKITNNGVGIILWYGSSNSIYLNNITVNNVGIQLIMSTDNKINHNNFFNNKLNANFYRGIINELRVKLRYELFFKIFLKDYYDSHYKPLSKNYWNGNYWNESRILPKPIYGSLRFFRPLIIFDKPLLINWINFDWHPAQEPYDIGG